MILDNFCVEIVEFHGSVDLLQRVDHSWDPIPVPDPSPDQMDEEDEAHQKGDEVKGDNRVAEHDDIAPHF